MNTLENTLFDDYYYAHHCGTPYQRSDEWLNMFAHVAKNIYQRIEPKTVLDAGCAMGFLVEQLRALEVEAYGMDISDYAIGQVHESIKDYCWVASITDAINRKYDLIVCIEVLEHLQKEGSERGVEVLCQATDDILFSSSPFDYKEATHFNVQPPEYWAELFARQGFFRDVDFDASFLTPWAVRFRRKQEPLPRHIRDFERKFWQLSYENVELRNQVCHSEQIQSEQDKKITHAQNELQLAQGELEQQRIQIAQISEQSQNALAEAQATHQQSVDQLQHQTQEMSEQAQSLQMQLQQTQAQLQQTQAQLQQTQAQIQQTHRQCQQAQTQLHETQAELIFIKNSRFWKMRNLWWKVIHPHQ